jgi:hypothetical protein
MTSMSTTESAMTTVSGIAAAVVGVGTLLLVLFPISIPILILTAVAVAPLALLGLVPILAVGIVAAAMIGVRAATRGMRGSHRERELLIARAER